MDASTYQLVKIRYKLLFAGIGLLGLMISIYPTMQFEFWFANYVNYEMHQPARDSFNGLLWALGFVVVGLINIVLCSSIVAFLVGTINNWNPSQMKDIFVRSKYPKHWFKEQ